MRRSSIILGCFLFACHGVQPDGAPGQIEGRIRRVGLFEGANPLVRVGHWSFVEVELRCLESAPFDGELRLDQSDRDGDVVTSVEPVALAPDGQWRPYQVYFVPSHRGRNQVGVRLFDHRGRLVRMRSETGEEAAELISPFFGEIRVDEILLVDLTNPVRLPHVVGLDWEQRKQGSDWVHARTVRALLSRELPERWQGLGVVDAIIWDDADAGGLRQQQVDALIDWVKAGGKLLITAGDNWQRLAKSGLARALPVVITGSSRQREVLQFSEDIVDDLDFAGWLEKQYFRRPIARCEYVEVPNVSGVVSIPADRRGNLPIAFRRLLGQGSLTFVSASLRALLPPPRVVGDAAGDVLPVEAQTEETKRFHRICEKVIARNYLALPKVREESNQFMFSPDDLFDNVRGAIGFRGLGAAFLVFAILFAVAYTFVATFGSFWFLKRRGWSHHCWSAFAIIGAAGMVIGTGMVWTLRGVTTKLRQTTLVDAIAGEDYGYATCLFGVRTPDHTRLDLRLPVGKPDEAGGRRNGVLMGMPPSTVLDAVDSTYVAPERYTSVRAGALMNEVPVRATLKEFHGFWHGPLGGTLEGKLVAESDGRFAEGSFLRNGLGVDLHECFILEDSKMQHHVGGAGPAVTIRCLYLGDLPASGPESKLDAEALGQRLYYRPAASVGLSGASPELIPGHELLLTSRIEDWMNELPGFAPRASTPGPRSLNPTARSANEAYVSLLLLSVFDLLDENMMGSRPLQRSHGRNWGCTHRITPSTAILIGFSDQPPPGSLVVDRKRLVPNKARTMYRFVVPVER